ncbi:THAP domain-containing protein 2 [Merluccius polli]|uniref:THAP domain-containing protein 2 n=1 Tax=Merluccius polli TaxID=89951 RepID=A0AA47P5F7_MERPO|nr:THAP domain-containing protein 2 [Merluccius polli]
MKKTRYTFQRSEKTTAEHCCVPLCSASAKFNSSLSFHKFPKDGEIRRRWIVNVRREGFTIGHHTRVCSRHFQSEDVNEPAKGGRRRLKPGAVSVLFPWNNYTLGERLGVRERQQRDRLDTMVTDDEVEDTAGDVDVACAINVHNYSTSPEPALVENHRLREEVAQLRQQVEEITLQQRLGLRRFAGSDKDIHFFTRHVIELSLQYMMRVTRTSGEPPRQSTSMLQSLLPVDQLFLFLNYLTMAVKQNDLADRYGIHQSTVSRIVLSWSNFFAFGCRQKKIKEYLPPEFKDYADTTVILDCTELRYQTPSSPLLQSEVYSSYKSHCTLKGMIGMVPHGAVTFVSPLYAGSVSDNQLLVESGISKLLRPDSAIMVDRGFLVANCVPCKVYRPAFLAGRKQMIAEEVRETQSIAHLRVHVERLIRRLKEHKLFNSVIPLNMFGNINQLFVVACLLLNYQTGPLVKAWAK